ncbi:MAG: SDR family oxidoreductase [Fusobacterium sp.]|nr:SDR family oxidoreductase [Fusobacterium sp.]
MFKGKVVVITGAAKGIGKCIADEFKKQGAHVCIIDKEENNYFTGDISDENTLIEFKNKVINDYGKIDFLINNALPNMKGIEDCSFDEFNYALKVGITAPFYLTKLFMPFFPKNSAIVNISSTRDRMSQANTESYSAAKGGISALTHALAISLAGKVRVNSVSPGWINTSQTNSNGSDLLQHPVGRIGEPLDIANMVLFLCSEKAGFITGENICVDGGMTKLMIYHGENGWYLK